MKEVYNALIARMNIHGLRFHSVIALRGKQGIYEHAICHEGDLNCCYITDGDFDFILNGRPNYDDRILQCNKYCFENYLFNEKACCQIVYEQLGNVSKQEVLVRVGWIDFVKEIEAKLIPVFAHYAVAHELAPSITTVSTSFGAVIRQERGRCRLDKERIDNEISRVVKEILKSTPENQHYALLERIMKKIGHLPNKTDIISGKDCLLKLLSQHITHCSSSVNDASLKMRLMLNTDIDDFYDIRSHIAMQFNKQQTDAANDIIIEQ